MPSFLGAEYVTPIIIRDSKRRVGSETLNLRFRSVESSAQYWEIDLSLAPDTGDNNIGGRLAAHQAQMGMGTAFDIPMPQHVGVGGNPDTNTLSNTGNSTSVQLGGNSVGHSIIVASLAAGSEPIPVKAGQFVRFTGQRKVYMITQDVTLVVGTARALNIYPPLVENLAASRLIGFDPMIRVIYSGRSLDGVDYRRGIVTQVRVRVREAL